MAGQSDVDAKFIGWGRIIETGMDSSRGNYVAYELLTDFKVIVYYHLKSVALTTGEKGTMGKKIGVVGQTGTGAIHLHMMVFENKANYAAYNREIPKAPNENEKARISTQYTMDPANFFSPGVCGYPGSVTSSNNGLTPPL